MLKKHLHIWFVLLTISYHSQNLLLIIYYLFCGFQKLLSQVDNLICIIMTSQLYAEIMISNSKGNTLSYGGVTNDYS